MPMISRIPSEKPSYSYRDLAASFAGMLKSDIEEITAEKISSYFGGQHVLFFTQARVATYYYLRALGFKGKEVLCPDFTSLTFPHSICLSGAKIKFSDVEEKWINTEISQLKNCAGEKTKCFTVTPQFGFPCDMDPITDFCGRKKIILFEDNAPALGATYKGKLLGSFGHSSVISFDNSKHITSFVGGALLTNDDKVAERVKKMTKNLRKSKCCKYSSKSIVSKILLNNYFYKIGYPVWSSITKEFIEVTGQCLVEMKKPKQYGELISRFQLALINRQWKHLDENIEKRRAIAKLYYKKLDGCRGVTLFKSNSIKGYSPMKFPVLVEYKIAVHDACLEKGIDLSISFPKTCSEQFYNKPLKNAYYVSRHVLSLPVNFSMSVKEARIVAEKFLEAVETQSK